MLGVIATFCLNIILFFYPFKFFSGTAGTHFPSWLLWVSTPNFSQFLFTNFAVLFPQQTPNNVYKPLLYSASAKFLFSIKHICILLSYYLNHATVHTLVRCVQYPTALKRQFITIIFKVIFRLLFWQIITPIKMPENKYRIANYYKWCSLMCRASSSPQFFPK